MRFVSVVRAVIQVISRTELEDDLRLKDQLKAPPQIIDPCRFNLNGQKISIYHFNP